MSEIKRYDPMSFGPENAYLTEDATGDAVKYDDHVAALASKDAEIERLREALFRIAIKDCHVRRIQPNPDGAVRGIGGMIATFALVGKNGSYVTNEEIVAAFPDLAALKGDAA